MSVQLIAAAAGIVGPILFLSVLTLAGLLRADYDPVTRFGSDLAVGESGWLQAANFIVFGCLVIALAAGLRRGLAAGKALRACTTLLAVSGFGLILAGVLPTDLAGQPSTLHGAGHFVASLLTFGTLLVVFFLIAMPLSRDARWCGYARYSVVTGLVVGGLCVASLAAAPAATFNGFQAGPLAAWTGLVQRALFVVAFSWIAMMGLGLLRLARADGRLAALPRSEAPRHSAAEAHLSRRQGVPVRDRVARRRSPVL